MKEALQVKKVKRLVPKGTSAYQAAWLLDSEDDEHSEDEEDDEIEQNGEMGENDIFLHHTVLITYYGRMKPKLKKKIWQNRKKRS
jgi:hypothetical protein